MPIAAFRYMCFCLSLLFWAIQMLYSIKSEGSVIVISTRAHKWLNKHAHPSMRQFLMLFSIVSSCSKCCECCETCLFESQCRWFHLPLPLLSILIDFVVNKIPVWSSVTCIHVTSVCSVFLDTWFTASMISCWSSWYLSYLRMTSREACCRPSPGAQKSCWHKGGKLSAVLLVISL